MAARKGCGHFDWSCFYHHACCGADEGNRTPVASLEGWSSTIELHPQMEPRTGLGPVTPWLTVMCSTNWASEAFEYNYNAILLAGTRRIEHPTCGFGDRCSTNWATSLCFNLYWWERWVPTPLYPKKTELQSAAVADLLLSHIVEGWFFFRLKTYCYRGRHHQTPVRIPNPLSLDTEKASSSDHCRLKCDSMVCHNRLCKIWRPGRVSNPRPLAWQASALTNWATGPNLAIRLILYKNISKNSADLRLTDCSTFNHIRPPRKWVWASRSDL